MTENTAAPRKKLSLGSKVKEGEVLEKALKTVESMRLVNHNDTKSSGTEDISRLQKILSEHDRVREDRIDYFGDVIGYNSSNKETGRPSIDSSNINDAVNPENKNKDNNVASVIDSGKDSVSKQVQVSESVKFAPVKTYNSPIQVQNKTAQKTEYQSVSKKSKKTRKNDDSVNFIKQNVNQYIAKDEEIVVDEYEIDTQEYEKLYGRQLAIKSPILSELVIPQKKNRVSKNSTPVTNRGQKIVKEIEVGEKILVKDLSYAMSLSSNDVTRRLFKMGVRVREDSEIDFDTAALIASEFGHIVKNSTGFTGVKSMLIDRYSNANRVDRSPVVTIMGHVDHGKTSLLDAIRKSDVADHESGGITQHIGAYTIETKDGKKITFIDTPGHAAFREMRSRGAKVTDIVILVIAADDGIMPQTIEAIEHAKRANVVIIVAINKIDTPGADIVKVKQELMRYDILLEDFGGSIASVPVSAKTKENLDALLDAIVLQSEIMELSSSDIDYADGVIIESKIDKGRGVMSTVLVQNGILKVGDIVVSGSSYGKIRSIIDDKGRMLKSANPSDPVQIMGLDSPPNVGDVLMVVESEREARNIIDEQKRLEKEKEKTNQILTGDLLNQMASSIITNSQKKDFSAIIRGDVQGSVEAIVGLISQIKHDEINIKIISASVGAVSESDIDQAKSSNAVILTFNVKTDARLLKIAELSGIMIRGYSIIYELESDVKLLISDILGPIKKEEIVGEAVVKQVFPLSKTSCVAGCQVTSGIIKRGATAKVIRAGKVLHSGQITSLRHFKDEAKEVKSGHECGIQLANYLSFEISDKIEVCQIIEERRSI